MEDRYLDTQLMIVFIMKELAKRMQTSRGDKLETVLNMVDPGFSQTDLLRERPWGLLTNAIMTVGSRVLTRTPEMGSRTHIMAASAGAKSHGMYLEDDKVSTPSAFVNSEEGKTLQPQIFDELVEILERIEPGISGNI